MPDAPEPRVRVAVKPRTLTAEDRALALAFLDVSRAVHESGDPVKTSDAKIRDAAKRANVPEALLRNWATGGTSGVLDTSVASPGEGGGDEVLIDPLALKRPFPPDFLLDESVDKALFIPAHDCWDWMRSVFVEEGGCLYNQAHWHLLTARIGVLWTNVENVKNGKQRWGTCEFLGGGGAVWPKARAECQLSGWFGEMPDFLITIDAKLAARDDDRSFCSGAEHELLHAGIKVDTFGSPKFDQYGRPMFSLREHDAEEFVDCADRYGVDATAGLTPQLVAAANRRPKWTDDDIEKACGTAWIDRMTHVPDAG